MVSVVRVMLCAAVAASALGAPALAGDAATAELHSIPRTLSPHPTAVVIRAAGGGWSPSNAWLWFAGDGTVESLGFAGPSDGRNAAKVDFAAVDRIVVASGLCTANFAAGRPFILHATYTRIDVECGEHWRYLTDYDVSGTQQSVVHDAIRALGHLASSAEWTPTNDTTPLPDGSRQYHTAAAP